MKTGDQVRVIGIPPELPEGDELHTRELFEKCVGRIFEVMAVERIEGLSTPLLQLDVGTVFDKPGYVETIWIESDFVEPV